MGFSSLSSDDNRSDGAEGRIAELSNDLPSASKHATGGDVAVAVDPDKSVMVCRHWKSKGFCRLEAKCKFQHPDEKRGAKAQKGNTKPVKSEVDKESTARPVNVPVVAADSATATACTSKKPRR